MTTFLKGLKPFYAIEAARKFNINAVNCNSVLRVTCPCCFVCVCFVIPFFASSVWSEGGGEGENGGRKEEREGGREGREGVREGGDGGSEGRREGGERE